MKIAIIGGGISGLATAYFVHKFNKNIQLDLYEKDEVLGGKIKTLRMHGFCIEQGSNGFLSSRKDAIDLAKDMDIEHLLLKSEDVARKRYLFDGIKVHKIPENVKEFFYSSMLGVGSKIRVASEIIMPVKKNDSEESLQSFGYRRVGKEFTDKMLDAMSAGIFASTPTKLSVNAAFPAVVNLEKEYGSLTYGMLKKKKKEAGPGGVLTSFKNGMSTFIDELVKQSGACLKTNMEVESISKNSAGWQLKIKDGEYKEYDKIVLSTPSYISSRLVKNFNPELSELLRQIEYSPVSVVALGYDDLPDGSLDGFGLLTTKDANAQVLGILWDSSIFSDRATEGKKLIRVMIGGQRNPLLAAKEENDLIDIAIGAVRQIMGLYNKPLLTHVTRWFKGIPNYGVGHLSLIEKIFASVKNNEGLYLNSNAYKGVSFNDCIINSKQCALDIMRN